MPDPHACNKARLARDNRFDGLFFFGVISTGIFCRPICPATPAKECNVRYFASACDAALAGFRPCLRCRPEAAPDSPAWRGVHTTLARAVEMIDKGLWQNQTQIEFAERMGVSDRYLRKLFQQHFGMPPGKYANYRRALFAKLLLHQTTLPVAEIARLAGFGSVRRFNAVIYEVVGLSPRQLRLLGRDKQPEPAELNFFLCYRPPYNWAGVRDYFSARQIVGLESVSRESYSRNINQDTCRGWFVARHVPEKHGFDVQLSLNQTENLINILAQIRRLLDLDADSSAVATQLGKHFLFRKITVEGIRLPGAWTSFEAGVKAILGQQVSIQSARQLTTRLLEELGERLNSNSSGKDVTCLFPSPQTLIKADLSFLPMPELRRQALKQLARLFVDNRQGFFQHPNENWLDITGIGPWTLQYARLRMGYPDIFLNEDLGVRNAIKNIIGSDETHHISDTEFRPWGSYATLLLWQSLSQR